MAANLKPHWQQHYTLEEYFALEKASDRRFEYWDGEIVCMSGGTLAHGDITSNISGVLFSKLAGRSCRSYTADMAIRTPTLGTYRYPDASVVCGEVQTEEINGIDMLVNPVLIVEVLSPTTEGRDRNEKRIAYQAIPSLREYLIVSQDIPHVTHYVKEDQAWRRSDYSAQAGTIELPSVGIVLTLAEIYQGVKFE